MEKDQHRTGTEVVVTDGLTENLDGLHRPELFGECFVISGSISHLLEELRDVFGIPRERVLVIVQREIAIQLPLRLGNLFIDG
jgi:hypothetical protein